MVHSTITFYDLIIFNQCVPSASWLYGGILWHAFDALITSNSTQYLKITEIIQFSKFNHSSIAAQLIQIGSKE